MTKLPTNHGDFTITVFEGEHVLLTKPYDGTPLVRIHSECLTGDALGSTRCDCRDQLQGSMQLIGEQGGLIIYLRQEGRGIGLDNKVKAYKLQDEGLDTVQANEHLGLPVDARDYVVAAQALRNQKIEAVRLLTNNPEKIACLEANNIAVTRVPLIITKEKNKKYLATKKEKLKHLF